MSLSSRRYHPTVTMEDQDLDDRMSISPLSSEDLVEVIEVEEGEITDDDESREEDDFPGLLRDSSPYSPSQHIISDIVDAYVEEGKVLQNSTQKRLEEDMDIEDDDYDEEKEAEELYELLLREQLIKSLLGKASGTGQQQTRSSSSTASSPFELAEQASPSSSSLEESIEAYIEEGKQPRSPPVVNSLEIDEQQTDNSPVPQNVHIPREEEEEEEDADELYALLLRQQLLKSLVGKKTDSSNSGAKVPSPCAFEEVKESKTVHAKSLEKKRPEKIYVNPILSATQKVTHAIISNKENSDVPAITPAVSKSIAQVDQTHPPKAPTSKTSIPVKENNNSKQPKSTSATKKVNPHVRKGVWQSSWYPDISQLKKINVPLVKPTIAVDKKKKNSVSRVWVNQNVLKKTNVASTSKESVKVKESTVPTAKTPSTSSLTKKNPTRCVTLDQGGRKSGRLVITIGEDDEEEKPSEPPGLIALISAARKSSGHKSDITKKKQLSSKEKPSHSSVKRTLSKEAAINSATKKLRKRIDEEIKVKSLPPPPPPEIIVPYSSGELCKLRCLRLLPQFDKLSTPNTTCDSDYYNNPISDFLCHRIHPMKMLCYFDLHGKCLDKKCPMQHKKDFLLNSSNNHYDERRLRDIISYDPSIAGVSGQDTLKEADDKISCYISRLKQVKPDSSPSSLSSLLIKMVRQSVKKTGNPNRVVDVNINMTLLTVALRRRRGWSPSDEVPGPKDFWYLNLFGRKKKELKEGLVA